MSSHLWNAYSLDDQFSDRIWCTKIADLIINQEWSAIQSQLEKTIEEKKVSDDNVPQQLCNYLIPNLSNGNRLLHLVAEVGAPAEIATALIQLGAWRSQKNNQGETAAQIAHQQGRDHLSQLLEPFFYHYFPSKCVAAIEKRFNAYLIEQLKSRSLVTPCDPVQLSVLQEFKISEVWYRLLPGYGSVSLELKSDHDRKVYLCGRIVLPNKPWVTPYLIWPGGLLEQEEDHEVDYSLEFLKQQFKERNSYALKPRVFMFHRWESDDASYEEEHPSHPESIRHYSDSYSDEIIVDNQSDKEEKEDNYVLLDDECFEFFEGGDEEVTAESTQQQLLESFQTVIECLQEEGDRKTALKFIDSAVQLFPNNVDILQQKAKLLIQSEDYSQALKLLNQVADLGQALDSDFYEQRAEVYEALEQWAAAAQDYSSVVLINPDHPDLDGIYSNIGTVLAQQKDYEGSLAAYSKAIAHNPEMGPWYLNRALTYAQMERWSEAIADCTAALVDCPPLGGDGYVDHIYSQRALAHVGREDWAAAIADWQAILETHPQDPEALLGIAIACSQQNQLARSRYHRQQALAGAPRFDRCRWLFQQCRTPWGPSLKELAKRIVRSKI